MDDCRLEIKLADKPGALSGVLDVIAKNSGNLFSISHIREKAKEGYVPVILKFAAEKETFTKIVGDIESKGIEITEKKIGGLEETRVSSEFILIGHVIDTDIRDTIHSVCDGDVMVKSLDISLKSLKDPSSVFAELAAKNKDSLSAAMNKLSQIAKKKELLLITGIQT
jgi:ACT domain-containing protein